MRITQLGDVERFADASAQGDDQRPDLVGRDPVQSGLLDVEHLAEHRKDRLEAPIPPLLADPPAESPSTM